MTDLPLVFAIDHTYAESVVSLIRVNAGSVNVRHIRAYLSHGRVSNGKFMRYEEAHSGITGSCATRILCLAGRLEASTHTPPFPD